MTWFYFPLNIKLKAPALFRTLQGDPNSASTYPYVPGTAIRGPSLRYTKTAPTFGASSSTTRSDS